MKKGQITLFIIIGMLIVVSLGIAIYVAGTVKKELATARTISATEIEDTITSCLRQTTEEGLILLGKQGGHIFENQGGLTSDSLQETSITITPPIGNVGTFFYSTPPEYPFPTYPELGGEQTFEGYYGINNLPPLNPSQGQTSVKENLEHYINTKLPQCTNFAQFDLYTITAEEPSVNLVYAQNIEQLEKEQALIAELNWKIKAQDLDKNTADFEKFTTRIPARLGTTYYAAKQYADADVTDITYEPTTKLPFVVETKTTNKGSDITITDTTSTVQGIPYSFTIKRQNRAPALWLIENVDTIYVPPSGSTTLRINGNQLSAEQPCEKFTTIQLKANDPDNDTTTFSINDAQYIEISANDIPQKTIKVFAHDTHLAKSADYQEITLTVTLCAPQ